MGSVRSIPDPGFRGDDGSVAAEVAAALTAYDRDPDTEHERALAVLQHSRLLVPVVAVLGEVDHDANGQGREKSSDMATVLLRGQDGRMALLAFTGSAPLARWDPSSRPVPVTTRDAARAALQDQADALVIDVAGPVMFVVPGEQLRALADGFTLTDLGGRHEWTRPATGQ